MELSKATTRTFDPATPVVIATDGHPLFLLASFADYDAANALRSEYATGANDVRVYPHDTDPHLWTVIGDEETHALWTIRALRRSFADAAKGTGNTNSVAHRDMADAALTLVASGDVTRADAFRLASVVGLLPSGWTGAVTAVSMLDALHTAMWRRMMETRTHLDVPSSLVGRPGGDSASVPVPVLSGTAMGASEGGR